MVYKCPPVPTTIPETSSRFLEDVQLSSGVSVSSSGPHATCRVQHTLLMSLRRTWFDRSCVSYAREEEDADHDAGKSRGRAAGGDPCTRRHGCFGSFRQCDTAASPDAVELPPTFSLSVMASQHNHATHTNSPTSPTVSHHRTRRTSTDPTDTCPPPHRPTDRPGRGGPS